jgi:hypothetical protein
MWISWTQRPGSRVPTTHLQNLHNTSIALRYGAIITVLKTSWTALCTTKKINILTLVLSEKKMLNETKNHNPPPFKLNGWSHQNQNIFFSNIGNQNIFLEKNHNPFQVKWSFPNSWFICVNKILRKYDLKLNETKNHNSPSFKLNGRSLTRFLLHVSCLLPSFFSVFFSPWWQTLLKNVRAFVLLLTNEKLNMGNITMPEVEQATHLGIIKTTTMKHNIQTNVDEHITKARRSAYSLFGCLNGWSLTRFLLHG